MMYNILTSLNKHILGLRVELLLYMNTLPLSKSLLLYVSTPCVLLVFHILSPLVLGNVPRRKGAIPKVMIHDTQ